MKTGDFVASPSKFGLSLTDPAGTVRGFVLVDAEDRIHNLQELQVLVVVTFEQKLGAADPLVEEHAQPHQVAKAQGVCFRLLLRRRLPKLDVLQIDG